MTQTANDPALRTLNYALAPGAADEDIDVQAEEMLVNMGPQHPSTHGVLRIVLRTDGEMVLEAIPHLGYLHRCKEKIAENLAYYQYLSLIHISEPTRQAEISYAVFCLKKK